MNKKISIIVPVYNVEKHLEKCIDSILNQSYKNIELILINDGSKDNSGNICDEYLNKDNRIKVIHKINEGVSRARNTGISNATGEYIAFVDGDDWVDIDVYTKMIQSMNKYDVDLVMSKFKKIYPNGNEELSNEPIEERTYYNNDIFERLIIPMIGNKFSNISDTLIMGSTCRCLYKTKIIKENNLNFKKIKIAEDMVFHLSYLAIIDKVRVLDEYLYYYRYNNLSATNNYIDSLWETMDNQLNILENTLKDFDLLNDISKERLAVNSMCCVSWCFKNECNPQNNKDYRSIINSMKQISTYDRYKLAFKWSNILKVPLKERALYICIKLKLYNLVYRYHNLKFKQLMLSN